MEPDSTACLGKIIQPMIDFTGMSRGYMEMLWRRETRAAADTEGSQRRLLADLVRFGRDTLWGKEHGFRSIGSYASFRDAVPVTSYADVRPLVMRMVEGEADILAPGRVRRFAQSSGTSDGKTKYIPITDRGLRKGHYAGAAFAVASYLHHHPDSHIFGGKNFILGGSYANELTLPAGVKVGDLSATLIDRINPLANLVRIPNKQTALMADWTEKLPRLVKLSAREDVRSISGVPSWFLTVLKEVAESCGAATVKEVWPNLEVFFHGGIAFGPYRSQYERITGGAGSIRYWENYNASEGFFAVQALPSQAPMRLLMNADNFYEFIPADTPGAEPVPAWEVRKGEIYALVITSSNGLWRYPVGDTVKIESTDPLTVTIAGRTRHFINAFGEEVMVYNTDAALERACRETGAEVLNYTAAPVYAGDRSRGRHQWLVEFAKAPADMEEFADRLDRALQDENSDYQAKRSGGIFLDRLSVEATPAGLFDRWLATRGKLGGQRKIPRLSNDRSIMDPMLALMHDDGRTPAQQ